MVNDSGLLQPPESERHSRSSSRSAPGSPNHKHNHSRDKKNRNKRSSVSPSPAPLSPSRTCASCTLVIHGDFVPAMEKTWHPDCFKCRDCSRSLANGNYHRWPQDNPQFPLCDDDLARRTRDLCEVCNEPLKDHRVIVGGHKYHKEHYRCVKCDEELSTDDKRGRRGSKLYCHFHQATLFEKKCAACGEALFGDHEPDPDDPREEVHSSCAFLQSSWGITVVKFRPKVDRQTLTKENFLSNETTVSRFVHDLESRTRAFRNSASACVSNVNDTVFHGNWTEAILTVLRLENHLNAICGLKSVLGPQIKIPPTPGAIYKQAERQARDVVEQLKQKIHVCQSPKGLGVLETAVSNIGALVSKASGVVDDLIRVVLNITLTLSLIDKYPEAYAALLDKLESVEKELPRSASARNSPGVSPRIIALPPSSPNSPSMHSYGSLPQSSHSTPSIFSLSITDSGASDIFYLHSTEGFDSVSSLSLEKLCEAIREDLDSSTLRTISSILWRAETSFPYHEYLLAAINIPGGNPVWLRLERAAKKNIMEKKNFTIMSVSSQFAADDTATVANSSEKLIREKSTLVATVTFESPPPVAELERVMTYVMKGAPNYKLTKENCWFFCSVIVELLLEDFGGRLDGEHKHAEWGVKERKAIRKAWLAGR